MWLLLGKQKKGEKEKEISTKLSRSLIPFNRSKRNALMDDRMLTIEKSCALIFYFERKQSKERVYEKVWRQKSLKRKIRSNKKQILINIQIIMRQKRKASSFKTIIIKLQPSYLMWWLDKVSFEILSNLPRNV